MKRVAWYHNPAVSLVKDLLLLCSGAAIMLTALWVLCGPWLAAQLRYRTHHHGTTVLAATTTQPTASRPQPDPSKPATITIPAIDVQAPIVFDEPSREEWKVQLALRRGVLHYGDTAVPGQGSGNVAIFGHSSGQAWAPGDYKWVFTLLDKLRAGDQIEISYQGISYIYAVTGSRVVTPSQVEVLAQTTDPTLTLITCTPVGTDLNRLVVNAKLVQ